MLSFTPGFNRVTKKTPPFQAGRTVSTVSILPARKTVETVGKNQWNNASHPVETG